MCSYKVAKHVWNALKIAKVLVARGGTGVAFHPVITSSLLVSMSSVCGLSSSGYILAACLYVICVCVCRCESGMESLRIGHLSHWWFRPIHEEFPVAK